MNSNSRTTQPRAAKTRARLLEALEILLREREFEHLAIADIAREAGVAVGSVYSHFGDKTAFLEALLEERIAVLTVRLEEAAATPADTLPAKLEDGLRLAARSAYEQVTGDAHILRALLTYARLHGGDEHPAAAKLAEEGLAGVRSFLDQYRDQVVRPDLDEAAKVLNSILGTAFASKVHHRSGAFPGDVAPDDDVLIEAVAVMLHGYLTTP